jgi:hypothetical protein
MTWAEDHHDAGIQDEAGRTLAAWRLPEGAAGIARLHELIAVHAAADGDPGQVVVAIETGRGLWVQALAAAGYQVYGLRRSCRSPMSSRSPSGSWARCFPRPS